MMPFEGGLHAAVGDERPALDDEDVLARPFGDPAFHVQEDGLVEALLAGLEAADRRLDVDAAELGRHVELRVMDPAPGNDVGVDAAGRVLAEVGSPLPGADGQLDGTGLGHQAEVAVGIEEERADVAAVELVRPDGLLDGLGDLVLGVGGFHLGHGRPRGGSGRCARAAGRRPVPWPCCRPGCPRRRRCRSGGRASWDGGRASDQS